MKQRVLAVFTAVMLVLGLCMTPSMDISAAENLVTLQVPTQFYELSLYNYTFGGGTAENVTVMKSAERKDLVSTDGNWQARVDIDGSSFTINSIIYLGDELSVNMVMPDKFDAIYCIEKTKGDNGEFDIKTTHTQGYVTGVTTAFDKENNADSSAYTTFKLTLPERVTVIDKNAFKNNTKLIGVDFKGAIQSIGSGAFYGCNRLREVNLDDMFKEVANNTIPSQCFYACTSLSKVTIPDSIRIIQNEAFYQCDNIDYLILSDRLNSIGKNAFANCNNLRYLLIKSNAQDWKKAGIVSDNEITKIVDASSMNVTVAQKGRNTDVGRYVYAGDIEYAIFGRVDLDLNSVKVDRDGTSISTSAYNDVAYGYSTKAAYFSVPKGAYGTYTVSAKDILGNSVNKVFTYEKDIVDTTPPVIKITGTGTNNYYQSARIDISDADTHVDSMTLNGSAMSNSITITEEGEYTVEAIDSLGNKATASFIVDNTPPLLDSDVKDGEKTNKNISAFVQGYSKDIKSVTINGVEHGIKDPISIYESGEYTIVITDYALNSTKIQFILDKSGPTANIINNKIYNSEIDLKFSTLCGISSAVVDYTASDKTSWSKEVKDGTRLTQDGSYKLRLTDALNKNNTYNFQIDKTAPKITGVKDGQTYATDVSFEVTDDNIDTISLNGATTGKKKTIKSKNEGSYTLIATDKAGNQTRVKFKISTAKPKLSGIKDGKGYKKKFTFKINTSDIKKVVVNKKTQKIKASYTFKKVGKYVIQITNKAGSTAKYTVWIDKTKPTVTGVKNGASYSKAVTVWGKDKGSGIATVKLDKKYITKKTKVSKKGKHTVIITDKAGNKRTVKFTIK